ncbi:MAG: response regulator [Anaerolineae bacterium]
MPKILIAEDEKDLREFLQDEFNDVGFNVTAVANGADAVIATVEERFDIALLDMLMPGMDGLQAIRVLRKVAPGMPILGLTGHVGRGYMAQAAALGVTCLSKPVVIADLIKEVKELLAQNGSGQSVGRSTAGNRPVRW